MRPSKKRVTPSFAISMLALFLVLGGTGYAASQITSREIKNDTIQSRDVRNGALRPVDLHPILQDSLQAPEFAHLYNVSLQVVAVEAPVAFDTTGETTPAFTHAVPSDLTVNDGGTYEVEFSVSANEPNQFTVFVNGVAVPGSTYGSGAGTQQNNGHIVVTLAAGDVLNLVNHTSAAAVSLPSLIGGTASTVNASLTVTKLT